MTTSRVDTAWLAALHARARQPPRVPRLALWSGGAQFGSVEPGFVEKIAFYPAYQLREPLSKTERDGKPGWEVHGALSAGLADIAQAMRQAGLAGPWRDETLAVTDAGGHVLGVVERAAVRPLGIATRAVHLVGQHPDGRQWVQKRSMSKANDPGLWDTLMGGMVSASDTQENALARETWEEAGLRLEALKDLQHGGRVCIRRPAHDGGGTGYVAEDIDWYTCTVPEQVVPANQDGEVSEFRLMAVDELCERMANEEFTLEAALIVCHALA